MFINLDYDTASIFNEFPHFMIFLFSYASHWFWVNRLNILFPRTADNNEQSTKAFRERTNNIKTRGVGKKTVLCWTTTAKVKKICLLCGFNYLQIYSKWIELAILTIGNECDEIGKTPWFNIVWAIFDSAAKKASVKRFNNCLSGQNQSGFYAEHRLKENIPLQNFWRCVLQVRITCLLPVWSLHFAIKCQCLQNKLRQPSSEKNRSEALRKKLKSDANQNRLFGSVFTFTAVSIKVTITRTFAWNN